MLGYILPVLAAGFCLLLVARLLTAALKLVFLVIVIALLLQFASVYFPGWTKAWRGTSPSPALHHVKENGRSKKSEDPAL